MGTHSIPGGPGFLERHRVVAALSALLLAMLVGALVGAVVAAILARIVAILAHAFGAGG